MTRSSFVIPVSWSFLGEGQRDLAEIRMAVGGQPLIRIVDITAGTIRDHARASAVSLALFLAENWWRLRWEPLLGNRPSPDWRLRHELTSIGGGAVWPPLMIYGTGPRVVLAPASGARIATGPIRHLDPDTVHVVGGEDFEHGLDEFFEAVLARCPIARDGRVLADLLAELAVERADADIARWRRLEARLGFDPDEGSVELIEALLDIGARIGEAGVEEAALSAPGLQAAEHLERALAASLASDLRVAFRQATDIERSTFQKADPAWRWGETAARRVREQVGVTTDLFPADAVATLFDTPWHDLREAPGTARALPYAAMLREGDDRVRLALQTTKAPDRRFELARMIADDLWTGGERLGIVSRARTDRQKFQRGFAQHLLCPYERLRNHIDMENPSEAEIDQAARHFQVNPSVVTTLLVNKNVLPRETLAERLDAA